MDKRIMILFVLLLITVNLVACSTDELEASIQQLENRKSQLEEENIQLKQKVKELESEIDKLKGTDEYLYKTAIEEKENKRYIHAIDILNDIINKYPNSKLVESAKKEIENINNILDNIEREKEKKYKETIALAEQQKTYDESIKILNEYINSKPKEEYTQKARELIEKYTELKNKPPLKVLKAWVTFNSIGNPEARVRVKNVSDKTIDAYTLAILTFNNFNKPVEHYLDETNVFGAIAQHTIKSGRTIGDNYYWTLFGHDNTTKIKAILKEVHFTDDTTWENSKIHDEIREQKNKY